MSFDLIVFNSDRVVNLKFGLVQILSISFFFLFLFLHFSFFFHDTFVAAHLYYTTMSHGPPPFTTANFTPYSSPQKHSGNRILLVETNNGSNNNSNVIASSVLTQQSRVERLTLQEVPGTSPTYYYGSASLSYSSSIASTLSTASTASTRSQPTRFYTPPASPTTDAPPLPLPPPQKTTGPSSRGNKTQDAICDTAPLLPSWTNRLDRQTRTSPFPPWVVGHPSTPLGWLRPSLTSTALLDPDTTHHPSYFVFLAYGPVSARSKPEIPPLV